MGWGRAGLAAPAMRRLHPAGAVGLVEVQQQVQGSAGEKLGSRVVALGGPGGALFQPRKEKKIKYGHMVVLSAWFGAARGLGLCLGGVLARVCPSSSPALSPGLLWKSGAGGFWNALHLTRHQKTTNPNP